MWSRVVMGATYSQPNIQETLGVAPMISGAVPAAVGSSPMVTLSSSQPAVLVVSKPITTGIALPVVETLMSIQASKSASASFGARETFDGMYKCGRCDSFYDKVLGNLQRHNELVHHGQLLVYSVAAATQVIPFAPAPLPRNALPPALSPIRAPISSPQPNGPHRPSKSNSSSRKRDRSLKRKHDKLRSNTERIPSSVSSVRATTPVSAVADQPRHGATGQVNRGFSVPQPTGKPRPSGELSLTIKLSSGKTPATIVASPAPPISSTAGPTNLPPLPAFPPTPFPPTQIVALPLPQVTEPVSRGVVQSVAASIAPAHPAAMISSTTSTAAVNPNTAAMNTGQKRGRGRPRKYPKIEAMSPLGDSWVSDSPRMPTFSTDFNLQNLQNAQTGQNNVAATSSQFECDWPQTNDDGIVRSPLAILRGRRIDHQDHQAALTLLSLTRFRS